MKKTLLFLSLVSVVLFAFPEASMAKKRYRYIKRGHGVRMQLNSNYGVINSLAQNNFNFNGTYTFNYNGRIEVGPYIGINLALPATVNNLQVGLLTEYNFIKNRGKQKFVPSAGLAVGFKHASDLELAAVLSLKYFVAKRTSIIGAIKWLTGMPFASIANVNAWNHNVDLQVGFAYYFDFY